MCTASTRLQRCVAHILLSIFFYGLVCVSICLLLLLLLTHSYLCLVCALCLCAYAFSPYHTDVYSISILQLSYLLCIHHGVRVCAMHSLQMAIMRTMMAMNVDHAVVLGIRACASVCMLPRSIRVQHSQNALE